MERSQLTRMVILTHKLRKHIYLIRYAKSICFDIFRWFAILLTQVWFVLNSIDLATLSNRQ